jgi:hypothetical protein
VLRTLMRVRICVAGVRGGWGGVAVMGRAGEMGRAVGMSVIWPRGSWRRSRGWRDGHGGGGCGGQGGRARATRIAAGPPVCGLHAPCPPLTSDGTRGPPRAMGTAGVRVGRRGDAARWSWAGSWGVTCLRKKARPQCPTAPSPMPHRRTHPHDLPREVGGAEAPGGGGAERGDVGPQGLEESRHRESCARRWAGALREPRQRSELAVPTAQVTI